MKLLTALALSLGLVAPALAGECTLGNAAYGQPNSSWTLQFKPVGAYAAANTTASFTLGFPKGLLTLDGDVYQPNGYSSSNGSIVDPECESADGCALWSAIVYTGQKAGISVLASERDAPAPRQVLLPGLGSALWYSKYREPIFTDTAEEPEDVFTLKGCAP